MGRRESKLRDIYDSFGNGRIDARYTLSRPAVFPPFKQPALTPSHLNTRYPEVLASKPDSPGSQPALTRRQSMAALGAGGMALGALVLQGCGLEGATRATAPASDPVAGSTFAFDTYCTFSVYGDAAAPAKLAQECARYDKLFDAHSGDSDIARINNAGGEPVEVAPETAELIAHALEYCAEAEGLFDITIGAVSTLWDFKKGVRPSDEAIAAALPHVDYACVKVDEAASTVRLTDPQAKLDLGGIAKGYAADKLCELLASSSSATGAVISLGGNIAFYGEKPDGSPWEAGIRDPNDPGGSTTVGTARVGGGSLVTSGLYERTFELDGETYWHILDPRTGMPVKSDVVSSTVYCPSSLTADALSTTLFVAGSRVGAAIADAHEDTAAYFILNNGAAAESTHWQELTDFS